MRIEGKNKNLTLTFTGTVFAGFGCFVAEIFEKN